MDQATVEIYERSAAAWTKARSQRALPDELASFAGRLAGPPPVDLGCGPGWHARELGCPAIALDAALAMLELVPDYAPDAWRVQADLSALPFARATLGGAWANKSFQHVPAEAIPLALAGVHDALVVGAPLHLRLTSDQTGSPDAGGQWKDDPYGGRYFAHWPAARLADVLDGAGFVVEALRADREWLVVDATRARRLADFVAPAMRLLLVGLNPSEYAADAGVGFARPGNRFWPAALDAGIVTRDRDPWHALRQHGVGMTDLVKRATPRADALARVEYRTGADRVERLVAWLQPNAVAFVGLAGYRAARDSKATVGWQRDTFGGRPAYVMPNPSGLNAHTNRADMADHFRAALAAAPPTT